MRQSLDAVDRRILNALQGGFPIAERPFKEAAGDIGLEEADLIARIQVLLDSKVLSRFGPLYNAENLDGAVTLAALAVPEERFDEVTALVNGFSEVAHNYRREHRFNMWFVVACMEPARVQEVLREIEEQSGLAVLDLPKEEEFFLEFKLTA